MHPSTLKLVPTASPATSTGPDLSAPVEPVEPVAKPVFEAPKPANDPFLGLISGTAPDPSTEIPTGPEPARPVEDVDAEPWQPKILDLDSAREETGPKYLEYDQKTGNVTLSNMAEAEFVEWWAIDVWDAIAGIGGCIPGLGLDLSEIRTDENDYEQARTAAKHLYKIALRHPKWLGWMISENTVAIGDWLFCVSFFGGKGLAIYSVIMSKKRDWAEKKRAKKNRSQPVDMERGKDG